MSRGSARPSAETRRAGARAKDPTNLRGDARLVQLLRNAVDAADRRRRLGAPGEVGGQIGNQASFDPRNYGYRKLSDLIDATGLFEVKRTGQIVLIRDKRRA